MACGCGVGVPPLGLACVVGSRSSVGGAHVVMTAFPSDFHATLHLLRVGLGQIEIHVLKHGNSRSRVSRHAQASTIIGHRISPFHVRIGIHGRLPVTR